MALLQVTGLSVDYVSRGHANHAVNNVSLQVNRGEVVGVVGESGSGKSTAMLAMLGLTRQGAQVVSGSVTFDGTDTTNLSIRQWQRIRGERIGPVTQNPRGALSPVSQVGKQLSAVYSAHRPNASKDEAFQRGVQLLQRVGINDPERRMAAFPHELSGGMAQRVVIAMGLACDPDLLIADEPTSGLDVTVQAQVLDDLRNAAEQSGSAMLLVTQDLSIVANYCDRVYLMHAGEVVEQAPVADIFERPAHPATAALLAAQRRMVLPEVALRGGHIDGNDLGGGCWLAPRCPFADGDAGCLSRHPALAEVADEHLVRCHRTEAVQQQAERSFAGEALINEGGSR